MTNWTCGLGAWDMAEQPGKKNMAELKYPSHDSQEVRKERDGERERSFFFFFYYEL